MPCCAWTTRSPSRSSISDMIGRPSLNLRVTRPAAPLRMAEDLRVREQVVLQARQPEASGEAAGIDQDDAVIRGGRDGGRLTVDGGTDGFTVNRPPSSVSALTVDRPPSTVSATVP